MGRETLDFKNLLAAKFEERKASMNRAYSLREFAFDLKIDAPTLHHLMSGKKSAGPLRKSKLLRALGYNASAIQELLAAWEHS